VNTFGHITTRECVNVLSPPDTRCQDAAFALANPDICPAVPHLIIKPAWALACAFGSTQFSAFLVTAGVEQDVSADSIWRTSDPDIALIGATSGNATGLTAGDVTISATYGDYTATAELTVMGCTGDNTGGCASRHVAMMMLVDTSLSMSQAFSGSYGTRLDFAKAAATRFASEVNETKDTIGLITFNQSGYSLVDGLTADKAAVEVDVGVISQTQQKTEFYNALQAAISELDASGADFKVIVLFSDGEDTTSDAASGYGDTDNPVALLSAFKDLGGIVICLGCRSSGVGFSLLSTLSTGGFFLNAYSGIESVALDYLSGLKGYICAGNCCKNGDQVLATGELNYSGFANWDVSGGQVDLMGNGFLDFLPGNGLYVDLAGSGAPTAGPGTWGRLVSKSPISLTSGHAYRLSLDLAGNQLQPGTYTVQAKVFYLTGTVENALLSQSIVVSDYTQDFHPYSYTFTAPADVSVYISLQLVGMVQDAAGQDANKGVLLNQVSFDDTTDLINLLLDTFDTENEQYVPPCCGQSSIYQNVVGYNCYGVGCLDEPPPAQAPDPNALPNIEMGGYTPPKVYSSSKTVCVSCGMGRLNQMDSVITTRDLISNPGDYQFPLPMTVTMEAGAVAYSYQVLAQLGTNYQTPTAWRIFGSDNGTTWTLLAQRAKLQPISPWTPSKVQTHQPSGLSALFYSFTTPQVYAYYGIEIDEVLPAAGIATGTCVYGLQIIGTGTVNAQACSTASGTGASQAAAAAAATLAATAAANAKLNCLPAFTATEQVTVNCPLRNGSATKSATGTSFVSQQDAQDKAIAAATLLAQAALDCTGSNNTHPSPIADATVGGVGLMNPFPSVKVVSGAPASMSSVTVSLFGLAHTWPADLQLFIMGPDGTCVGLMRSCGGSYTISDVDIVFQDGATALPTDNTGLNPANAIVSGTYQPTADPTVPIWSFAAGTTPTAPTPPAGFLLSAFNGKDGNGAWSLWVIDKAPGNTGTLAGGWDLTLA